MTLATMLGTDRDALICDLAETYHVLDMWALPVPLLATLASGLRENSRIRMEMAGMHYIPLEIVVPQIRDYLAAVYSKKGKKPDMLTDYVMGNKPIKKPEKATGFRHASDFDAWRESMMRK